VTEDDIMPSTSKALEFNAVSAGYHGRAVVHDFSAAIGEAEIVGLIGPNGAGKTTLLRCVSGLVPPVSGRVSVTVYEPVLTLAAGDRVRLLA